MTMTSFPILRRKSPYSLAATIKADRKITKNENLLPNLLIKELSLMEDKKVNIFAISLIITLVIVIVVARVTLRLSEPFYLIAGADIAAILAVFACLFIRGRLNRRIKTMQNQQVSDGIELRLEYSFLRKIAGVPTKFRLKELEEATSNFQTLIGKGGSASVFQGLLKDGTMVAVKRIEGEERGGKEFRSEVAAIASVQHLNLVRLIGYCCTSPKPPRYLVYDYIPNGSLARWIFPRKSNTSQENQHQPSGCLSWELRIKVAIDVAKALSYLHHDCRYRILHLDVKPENILLDENFRAVVSDFGLSKLMGRDESRVVTTLRGTKGYLAPEWLLELGVSEKSDVYSYGMVLLEIIGGRRNVEMIGNGTDRHKKFDYFPKIVRQKLREGKVMEVLDQRLLDAGGIEEKEVVKLVYVGLWCIQEKPRRRPSMVQVVEWLEGKVEVVEPPVSQMIIVDLLAVDEDENDGQRRRPRAIARGISGRLDSRLPSSSRSLTYSFSMISGR